MDETDPAPLPPPGASDTEIQAFWAQRDLMDRPPGAAPHGRRRCRATAKTTGEQCKRAPAPGAEVCRFHGGAARQVVRAAERRQAEAEAITAYRRHTGEDAAPVDLLDALQATTAEVQRWSDWCGTRVEQLTAGHWRPDEPRAAAEIAMYERALRLSSTFLADVARIGIEARIAQREAELDRKYRPLKLRVNEAIALRVLKAVRLILGDIALTPEQFVWAQEAVPRRLRELIKTDHNPEPPRRPPLEDGHAT